MTSKQELEKIKKEKLEQINKIYDELEPIRDELNLLKREEMLKNVGHCFKFKNYYSSTEEWWRYVKIVGVNKNLQYLTKSFEKTTYDIYNIENQCHYHIHDFEKMQEISDKEYLKAKADFMVKAFNYLES